ncbi:hypothetical protein LTR95_008908 [Oleoguttula sp. CCFEE 5521]
MDDMPDAYLRTNAVYPRSYFPRQMRSPPGTPSKGLWDDEDDGVEAEPGTTLVPVSIMDGSEAKLPVPRMTKGRRETEVALNELGYRMSWSQARTFNGRTLFLQRSYWKRKRMLTCTRSGRLPQQDEEHDDRWRTGTGYNCAAFRDEARKAKVARVEQNGEVGSRIALNAASRSHVLLRSSNTLEKR